MPLKETNIWENEDDVLAQTRAMQLTGLQNKDRSLQLAGTMALKKRAMSPLSKLRETRGQVTLKTVPDLSEQNRVYAKKEYHKAGYKYQQPKTYIYRNTDPGDVLAFGQTDFALITHPDQLLPNPKGLSDHNKVAEYHNTRVRQLAEKERIANGLKDKTEWHMYHKKLPMKHVPFALSLADKTVKKEASLYLENEKWETAFILLSRQVNDETIVGKP